MEILKQTLDNLGILQLTLNRPQALNALNQPLMDELAQVLLRASHDPTVKAILIHGEGKAFCAGADIQHLQSLNGQSGYAFAKHGQTLFRNLAALGKPSLAAIHGYALGGGCELAIAATLRIATTGTVFGQPEAKLGVIPGFGGTQQLARLIGKGRALDLCLTGRTIRADEALAWGLISAVTDPDELLTKARDILKQIINMAPLAIRSIINVVDHGYDLTLADALELEATHFGLCCTTLDKQEGVTAFLEKRVPIFTEK